MERLWNHGHRAILISAMFLLLYINEESLSNIQYTHIAILCVCAGALQIDRVLDGGSVWKGALAATILIAAGFCLRQQTIVPALIFLIGVFVARVVIYRDSLCSLGRGLLAVLPVIGVCATLYIGDALFYENHPEWKEAKTYSNLRVGIQDSKDNSGIDKTSSLQAAGIRPEAFLRFKQFIYEPEMDNLPAVLKAKDIHKQGRKGVCGLAPAADMGLLQFELSNIKPKSTLLRFITPYVPIAVALFVLIAFPERKRIMAACLILGAVSCYLFVLALMDRMVGRVLNPVLYTAGLYVLSMPFVKKPHAGLIRSAGVVAVSCLACAFCLRHYRPFEAEPQEALEYCQSKPDTQFYTCCMQGCGLYPTGFGGYTFNYLKNTNVIPIADGWIFYTPAYKAMLETRGIDNPYLAMLSPNVELITFTRHSSDGTLQAVADEILRQSNVKVSFELVKEVPNFAFWRIEQGDSNNNNKYDN